MRIALYHNAPSGGAKRAIYEWTKRLSADHSIDVFTLSCADHAFCDIRPVVHKHQIYNFQPSRLFNSPFGRLNQWQRRRDLERLMTVGRLIAGEIDQGYYDVVFAHTDIYTVIPTVLQFVKAPKAYYLHEALGSATMQSFRRPYFRENNRQKMLDRYDPFIAAYYRRLDTLQRNSVSKTDLLLANSSFTRALMQQTFDVETPVCHYGVDHDSFRPMPDLPKEKHVLSVGELSPRKGFDFVVESLGRLPSDKRPKLRLVCNSVQPQERRYVEDLALEHGVELEVLVNLNTVQLAAEYNKAPLCVYAPVREPFGLVPVEAMSCGTPVIGVSEGGVQESIVHGQTGLLVERDPALFAEAIDSLLANPTLCAEYGRNGRAHVLSHWTWEQSVSDLVGYLSACASS